MNGVAIQLSASALALGVMGSAVGVHFFNVKKTAALASQDSLQDNISYVSYESKAPQSYQIEGEVADFESVPLLEKSKEDMQLELLERLVLEAKQLNEEIEKGRKETMALKEQVAEANRDLSQLQFRVDTHSESFRPMRVSEDRTFHKALPAQALPAHQLLPPKNW